MDYLKRLDSKYPHIAYLYAAIGNTFLALMQIVFKDITKTISPFQALFLRAFSLFLFNTVILYRNKQSPYVHQPFLFRQVLKRMAFSTVYGAIVHYCVKYLPVSTVATLSNTGPIFIFFIETIYYKKPIHKVSLILTVISFVGVILVLQPSYIFSSEEKQIQNFQFLSMMVLFSAFCFAMAMLYVHDVAKKMSTIANLHYSYIGHMLLTGIIANFQAPTIIFENIDVQFCFMFLLLILLALVAQYMIFAATTLKKPSYTMPLGYLGILVSFLADIFYFGVKFNFLSVLGLILTSIGLLSKFLIGQQPHTQLKDGKQQDINQMERNTQKRINQQEQIQKI